MKFKIAAAAIAMTAVIAGSFFMVRSSGKEAITASDNSTTTDWRVPQLEASGISIPESTQTSSLATDAETSDMTSTSSTDKTSQDTSKSNTSLQPGSPTTTRPSSTDTKTTTGNTTRPNQTTDKTVTTTRPTSSNPTTRPPLPTPINQTDGGPVKAPQCGAYWGAYVNSPSRTGGSSAPDKLRALQIVENKSGRTFDLDHQFYRWDDFLGTGSSSYHIDNYIKPTINQGRIPFISWKPVMKNNDNISWASIANGSRDNVIREKARKVKSIGSPVILVFGHEADSRIGAFQPGKTEGGHVKTDAGSAQDFANAYRHVHNVFRAEGVTNVSWAWVMTRAPFTATGERAADNLYPGNEYVDIVGIDPYNFFHGGRNWAEMDDLMQGFTNWNETRKTNKPWMIAEWGSVEDPNQTGRKAQWLRNAADYFESEPRLKYITHFDSYPEYNWKIDTSPSSEAAWREISNRPYFKQAC